MRHEKKKVLKRICSKQFVNVYLLDSYFFITKKELVIYSIFFKQISALVINIEVGS